MNAELLRALPPGRDRRLARGETLFRAGDAAIGLVLVREGTLELVRTSPEGRRLVLHRAGPGDTFAEASLFESHHHCDAVAAAPSLVMVYPAAELRRAAEADPGLGWRIAAHLAARLRTAARLSPWQRSRPSPSTRPLASRRVGLRNWPGAFCSPSRGRPTKAE